MTQSGSAAKERGAFVKSDSGSAAIWLKRGWDDLWNHPGPSLVYGVIVFTISWVIVASLFRFDLSAYLFPVLAGFLILGPVLALGLYDKSRRIENGEPVSLAAMLLVRPRSVTQILFSGVLLCMLMLLWMRRRSSSIPSFSASGRFLELIRFCQSWSRPWRDGHCS